MFAEERVLVRVCDMHFDVCAVTVLKMQTGRHAHLMFLVKIPFCAAVCATFLKNMKSHENDLKICGPVPTSACDKYIQKDEKLSVKTFKIPFSIPICVCMCS